MRGSGWEDLELFMHVALSGGLSGAAERNGLSAPTIGRRMLALERRMGRALFVRSPQGYRLAPDGEILLEHVREMHRTAEAIAGWHDEAFSMPIVSIASNAWLTGYLADHVGILRQKGDNHRLCIKDGHRGVDLTYREADVALLHAEPTSGNLAIRKSIRVRHAVYAASDIAGREDLPWISIGTQDSHLPSDKWVFQNHERGILTWTNSPNALPRLIAQGVGQGLLPCFVGDRFADLSRRGPIIADLDFDLWIAFNDDDRHRPEIRAVIDHLAAHLRDAAALFAGESR